MPYNVMLRKSGSFRIGLNGFLLPDFLKVHKSATLTD
jgi:hypothetical protein